MNSRLTIALILAAALFGLVVRLPRLSERPMHCDEAVHAIKFNTLWQTGEYIYDPSEYHGPTLYYFALPLTWLSGAGNFDQLSEGTLRLTPVLFGVILIVLLVCVRDGLGSGAAVWSAVLTAVSPAFVYYSRYYIQEILLVCFTFAAVAFAWRWANTPKHKWLWAICAGAAVGLMHGTKETCVIAWGAAGISLLITRFSLRDHIADSPDRYRLQPISWPTIAIAAVSAAVVSLTLFTAFFQNWRGPLDSLLTYKTYFDRAGNHGLHNHPALFYWERLIWWRFPPAPVFSEVVIFVAGVIGGVFAIKVRSNSKQVFFQRFILFYTLVLTGVYTVIPYKTPWCALGFLHGWILLAGIGLNGLIASSTGYVKRGVVIVAGLCGVGWLYMQSQSVISRKFAADHRNPYVYAHTVNDLLDLATFVEKIAAFSPEGQNWPVHVFATDDDFWPLPWYLRRLRMVGYWPELTPASDADVVIVSLDLVGRFEAEKAGTYPLMRYYGLRPGVQLAVFVSEKAWEAFRASQPKASAITSEAADESR